ncbi:hypothetical protein QWZ10_10485 [Paracoccus cavernae]|uniref:Uncharacterized protein n=1 Tax=Paracoccus cavernae TaxID=1571207 RepID=A0ABT8D5Q3_9RHOB|nr:hypothetical protein [Paracoccus cavernae]
MRSVRVAAGAVALVVLALMACPRLAGLEALASRLGGVSLQWISAAVAAAVQLMIRARQRMAVLVLLAGLHHRQP